MADLQCGGFFGAQSGSALKMDSDLNRLQSRPFYWHFPSDHLPVLSLASVRLTGERFVMATWNMLNTNYLHHIVAPANAQGLRVSEITESGDRAERLMTILRAIAAGSRPSLFALQEVDPKLLLKIRTWGNEAGYRTLIAANPLGTTEGEPVDFGVFLVDKNRFEIVAEAPILHFDPKGDGASKYIQTIALRTPLGAELEVSNVHRHSFDSSVFPDFLSRRPRTAIIAGDMNLDRAGMGDLLKCFQNLTLMGRPQGAFSHINTKRQLSEYDHFLFGDDFELQSEPDLDGSWKSFFQISWN